MSSSTVNVPSKEIYVRRSMSSDTAASWLTDGSNLVDNTENGYGHFHNHDASVSVDVEVEGASQENVERSISTNTETAALAGFGTLNLDFLKNNVDDLSESDDASIPLSLSDDDDDDDDIDRLSGIDDNLNYDTDDIPAFDIESLRPSNHQNVNQSELLPTAHVEESNNNGSECDCDQSNQNEDQMNLAMNQPPSVVDSHDLSDWTDSESDADAAYLGSSCDDDDDLEAQSNVSPPHDHNNNIDSSMNMNILNMNMNNNNECNPQLKKFSTEEGFDSESEREELLFGYGSSDSEFRTDPEFEGAHQDRLKRHSISKSDGGDEENFLVLESCVPSSDATCSSAEGGAPSTVYDQPVDYCLLPRKEKSWCTKQKACLFGCLGLTIVLVLGACVGLLALICLCKSSSDNVGSSSSISTSSDSSTSTASTEVIIASSTTTSTTTQSVVATSSTTTPANEPIVVIPSSSTSSTSTTTGTGTSSSSQSDTTTTAADTSSSTISPSSSTSSTTTASGGAVTPSSKKDGFWTKQKIGGGVAAAGAVAVGGGAYYGGAAFLVGGAAAAPILAPIAMVFGGIAVLAGTGMGVGWW